MRLGLVRKLADKFGIKRAGNRWAEMDRPTSLQSAQHLMELATFVVCSQDVIVTGLVNGVNRWLIPPEW